MTEPRRAAKRIGHKGADLISPGNTLASFDAALAAGVDMVEFDVLPERADGSGRLVLAPSFDAARFLRRLREDDPTRPIGDALLDQRTVAGLGTIWRSEGCFAAGVDPWRATGAVSDEEALAVVEAVRPPMARSATEGFDPHKTRIYGKSGRPCPRCGTPIRSGGQGDNNRRTYWCPECQR